MKITLIIFLSIALVYLPSCKTDNESISEIADKSTSDSKLTSKDISLSVEFTGYITPPSIKEPGPDGLKVPQPIRMPYFDSLNVFGVSSSLKNESNDTLIFLNRLCATETFYSTSPASYRRLTHHICWAEQLVDVRLAPGETYNQGVYIGYPKTEIDSILPAFKLRFLFQNLDETRNTDTIEVWSDAIRIPSDRKK
jgi:hypothetical protein